MLNPSELKEGQTIQLKQVAENKWQEWLIDKDGNIVSVEDIDPFKFSKKEAKKPNNYEELKKNYVYLEKKEEPAPFQLDLPTLDNNDDIDNGDDIDTPKEEPNIEDRDCGEGNDGDPQIEEEEEKETDREIKEEENHEPEQK